MPNRILREGILESQRVNALTEGEEVFYRRLMSIVDDYGRYEAHPALLRARLYPLKLDDKSQEAVAALLNAVSAQRLAFVYQVAGKIYLQLLDFKQQTRSDSRYPAPDAKQLKSFAQHMHSKGPVGSKPEVCAAFAKHMLANAHLGVVVFGCDVVVGGVVGDVVVDGVASATQQTTDAALSSKKPENIEAVIAFGHSIGLSEDESRKFFQFNKGNGWKATRGVGESWGKLMELWKLRDDEAKAARSRASKNSSKGADVPFDPTKPNAHTGGLPIV